MSVNSTLAGINVDQEFQSTITDDDGVVHNFGDGQWLTYYPAKRNRKMYLNLIKDVGFRRFRVASGDISTGSAFRDDRFACHLHTCRFLFELGRELGVSIHVEFGAPPKFHIKPSEWEDWINIVYSYAQQFESLVQEFSSYGATGTWMLGNENENASVNANNYREAATSMSRTSNVVTVVMSAKHNMQTGDQVRFYTTSDETSIGTGSILGIAANSAWTITRVDDYTFTFSSTGTDGTASTGWFQYTANTVRFQMKRRATAFKNAGFTLRKSYSCFQGQEGGAFTYYISNFASSVGRGDIDDLNLNIYNGIGFSNRQNALNDFCKEVQEGIDRVGLSNFSVTEWHNAPTNSGLDSDPKRVTYWLMQRSQFLQRKGVKNYLFCLVKESDELAMKRPYNTEANTNFRQWWWLLINERASTIDTSASVVSHVSDVRDQKLSYRIFSPRVHWNYGQDTQAGTYSTTTINNDLNDYVNLGHTKIRTGGADYQSSGIATQRTLIQAEKAKGLYVNYVLGAPHTTLTDANFGAFKTFLVSEATLAVSYGIDEVCIANELENYQVTSGTVTNIIDKLFDVYDTIHALFPNLKMNISMSQSKLEYTGASGGWIERKAEVLQRTNLKLGYNIYADSNLTADQARSQFTTRLTDLYNAFGPDVLFISEGVLGVGTQRPSTEFLQGVEINHRVNMALALGIKDIYLFTYRWDSANTDNQAWPIRVGNGYKDWFRSLYTPVKLNRTSGISSQRHDLEVSRHSI